jgi:hypothetical protein
MPDDLTDTQVVLLCELGELQPSGLSSDQKCNLDRLASDGFVLSINNRALSDRPRSPWTLIKSSSS